MSSPKTFIKICGLRDAATIEAMEGLPVGAIGLMFAPSKRRVTPAEGGKLIAAAHRIAAAGGTRPLTVGVFVNAGAAEIRSVLAEAPLDIVQLHGDETPDYCREMKHLYPGLQVWKALSIREADAGAGTETGEFSSVSGAQAALERLRPYADSINAWLIDAPGGGTGQPFNWQVIADYKQASEQLGKPLFVAGGLNVDNVEELMRNYSPAGVDVSSGVETDGRKDIDKIRLFVRRVMEA